WDRGGKVAQGAFAAASAFQEAPPEESLMAAPTDSQSDPLTATSTTSTSGIVETITLRGLNNEVLREYQVNGGDALGNFQWTKDYIYAGSRLLAEELPGAVTRHYHVDHLGIPRLITDQNGNVVTGPFQYLPFGEEALSPPADERLRFTGHERDIDGAGITLDYMHARFYFVQDAKFLSIDPGRDFHPDKPQSWNLYSYTSNQPVTSVDRTGRFWEQFAFSVYNQIRSAQSTMLLEAGSGMPPSKPASGTASPQSARAGPNNSVIITYSDGAEEVRAQGSRAWRNNNPGNIRGGASLQGEIGEAGGFAVFGTEGSGQGAIVELLSRSSYQSQTVAGAIARWAPPNENNTVAYQRWIETATGLSAQTRLNTLSRDQLRSMANAIRRIEGWNPGTVTTRRP
ncbi:MAG TPA: RHS repeat-associated core domain-containing protein, partial [Pyrinomonadaceae bacterium]|nr:RHS repeat-associated core domain-containing protein [Pyrinomonadaceae bacterium]